MNYVIIGLLAEFDRIQQLYRQASGGLNTTNNFKTTNNHILQNNKEVEYMFVEAAMVFCCMDAVFIYIKRQPHKCYRMIECIHLFFKYLTLAFDAIKLN